MDHWLDRITVYEEFENQKDKLEKWWKNRQEVEKTDPKEDEKDDI